MGVDWSTEVYLLNYNMFARPVMFYPIKSQPSVPSYTARGIFSTIPIDIIVQDGGNLSDQKTILDILEREFAVLPVQQDRVYIGLDTSGMPAIGTFEIQDIDTNGGGESTLTLRRWVG